MVRDTAANQASQPMRGSGPDRPLPGTADKVRFSHAMTSSRLHGRDPSDADENSEQT